ncbi:RTA-like protein [Penicillium diatomitis]|uniref:RTA-like protein n=1 Tax=Penicillium diatomitis TaxID=2819901 RepID=A0A9W9XEU7_9EURO|nr:RTA-like protein [Penicillium diatomitis]KAJ5490974.1 RTA-like protein [Penicillium diatomitis]
MSPDNLYGYTPSIPAAVIFAVLFCGTTLAHLIQMMKFQCWYFLPFTTGGIFQIVGYVCRVVAHYHLSSIPIYAMQSVLILLAPPLYAASIYMVLGRSIVHLHAEKSSLIPVRWLTKIFVSGDVFSFLLQSAGGGLMATGKESSYNTGSYVVIGGLVVQLIFFGVFVMVAACFHYRMLREIGQKTEEDRQRRESVRRRSSCVAVLWTLYTVSALILARSVFRLVEYKTGYNGYIMTHEVFGYIFDSLLMFLVMIVMNLYHPAAIIGTGKEDAELQAQRNGNVWL